MNKRKYITAKVKEIGYKYKMNKWAIEAIAGRIISCTNITVSEIDLTIKTLINEELRRHKTA